MEKRIGIGLITYNRPEYFKQSLEALKKLEDEPNFFVVIINDGSDDKYLKEYDEIQKQYLFPYIEKENGGVASAKNMAVNILTKDFGVDYVFLIEDDIIVKDISVFDEYIYYSEASGLKHFNFAHHGVMNHTKLNDLTNGGYKVGELYPNCVGAFSFYTSDCFSSVGLFDENFKNAWEHVEHTNRLAKKGYTTPFWYFVDIPNSKSFLTEIEGSIDNSSIRPNKNWSKNIKDGLVYWKEKDGIGLPPRR